MSGASVEHHSKKARYDNYRLYLLTLETEKHVRVLHELEERSDGYIFYGCSRTVGQTLIVMVPAGKIAEIHDICERFGVSWTILVSYGFM